MFRKVGVIFRVPDVKFTINASKINRLVTEEEATTKLLKVAIIGVPNVGKSTIINYLMDRKVCPTSSKVHTTRSKSRAVFTEGDSQIVFLDTPGLVNLREQKKYNLERSCLKDSKSSLQNADIIGVIHDVSNVWTRDKLDIKIIRLLEENRKKLSFLVLNKIDVLRSKRKLLDVTKSITEGCLQGKPIPGTTPAKGHSNIRGWPYFQDIFMVSALTGSGLADVKNYLIKNTKAAKWEFPDEIWTDQTAESIIVNSVKAKLLDFLPQEIPYQLRPELELFDIKENGIISTVVLVHCPSDRIAKLVAGVSDGKLRQITESLQHDLQVTFHNYVRIKVVLRGPGE